MKIHGIINTFDDFEKLKNKLKCRRLFTQINRYQYRQEYYRGQLNSSWLIKPSLTRYLKTKEQVIKGENELLELFKEEIIRKNSMHKILSHNKPQNYQNDWAWLIQAQHYGIPTRLLDWTLKPEVALYFAVDNPDFDNVEGQFLIIFCPSSIMKTEAIESNQYYHIHPKDISNTWFLNPGFFANANNEDTIAETRRIRQHGKFSIQTYQTSLLGLDEQPNFCKQWKETSEAVIEKYIIPATSKANLRLDLTSKNLHGNFLYANNDDVINEIQSKCKKLLVEIANNKK